MFLIIFPKIRSTNCKMKQKILLFLAFTFIGLNAKSQSTYYGAGLGQALYWGDLNSPDFFNNLTHNNGFAFQAFVRRHLNDHFAFKGNIMFSKVRGSDINSDQEWQRNRNLSFKSSINELSVNFEYYPLRFSPNTPYDNWSPYLSVGLAGFYFNPKAEINGNEFELQPLGTEGQGLPGYDDKYKKIAAAVSFGGGLAIRFSEKVIIHADVLCRRANTDYIDDLSGDYVNYFELYNSPTNGPLSATLADRTGEYLGASEIITRETGSQRGGKSVRDYYFSGMISFSIFLADNKKSAFRKGKSGIECPKF